MPQDDPKIFQLYLYFLQTHQIFKVHDPNQCLEEKTDGEFEKFVQIYVLAERLQDLMSKNELVRHAFAIKKIRLREMPKT